MLNNLYPIILIKMKHVNMQEILQRRKQSKTQFKKIPQEEHQFSKCVNKQLRQINDQTIDQLIRIAQKKENLHQDNKLDLLQVIACKSGVFLNKSYMSNRLKLLCTNVTQIEQNWQKGRRNYFILKGTVQAYQLKDLGKSNVKFNTQPIMTTRKSSLDQDWTNYSSIQQFQKYNPEYKLIEQIEHFRGIGSLFDPYKYGEQRTLYKLVAVNAVIAVIEESDIEPQYIVNDGMAQEDKIQILNYFPVLKVIGKKLNSFINNFKIKQYSLKELIYKKGEKPKSVYFLIRGQVNFQLVIEDNLEEDGRSSTPFIVNTQTVVESNYFGEEQIVFKSQRVQSAKAASSKCVVLQLERDKFQKLLENPQFNEIVARAARIKRTERMKKIQKAKQIFQKQVYGGPKIQGLNETEIKQIVMTQRADTKRRFSKRRVSQQKVKLMHGHILRQSPPKGQNIHFSMLQVNPDMYQAAKKKFRKYNVKPLKYQPKGVWDFKKVWKILNLQDVLQQQQIDISAPQGRKYFDSHRRFQQQVNEGHSLRPKTTSSSYRTKLQYIAYLQQFNL